MCFHFILTSAQQQYLGLLTGVVPMSLCLHLVYYDIFQRRDPNVRQLPDKVPEIVPPAQPEVAPEVNAAAQPELPPEENANVSVYCSCP